jgi:hypothetical protein
MTDTYTIDLSVCQGIIEETRILLGIWQPGMRGTELYTIALASGHFPSMSASRLQTVISRAFAQRYLSHDGAPATRLKSLEDALSSREFTQLLFLYTCRAERVLADFVRDIYWPFYAAGRESISNEEAKAFVVRAVQEGKTATPWPESTIERMASNLTGTCGDFGLLEGGHRRVRKLLPYRIEPRIAALLAYDLHFDGLGDNRVIGHTDWALFGLERDEVLAELKRLALKGLLIVQSAGGVTRVSWSYKNMEKLIDVLAQGEF